MAGITNNLFPPLVETYMPAFIRTQECRVYFSLSSYNSLLEIKNAQVIVSNQKTNRTVLDTSLYPSGIKIAQIQTDIDKKTEDKYYISISADDITGGIFALNQYYKVQIRFTSAAAPNPPEDMKLDSWLAANLHFFSEWSKVCLIGGISRPSLELNLLKGYENETVIFSTNLSNLNGKVIFEEPGDKEFLRSYRIQIFKGEEIEEDSGEVYTNVYSNPNEINYLLQKELRDNVDYDLKCTITTQDLYQESYSYKFSVVSGSIGALDATIDTEKNQEDGYINVKIKGKTTEAFYGSISIRRISHKDNFVIWEDICTVSIESSSGLDYTYVDRTAESGVWYRYGVQKRDVKGNRGSLIQTNNPVMMIYDDMFLTDGERQLNIKFNPQVSSFKKTVLESKTDTLGSKYPFIKRNAYTGYRQFPISGMITHYSDINNQLTNKSEMYDKNEKLFEDYNDKSNIHSHKDFILEREFREKVMDFLYKDNVKLFRSTSEGNVLVKLMDISLTPEQRLGRMIYTFSCTAYEVDESTIKNYDKYGVISLGTYEEKISFARSYMGQVEEVFKDGAAGNLLRKLQSKYTLKADKGLITTVQSLSYLKITFNGEPYPIQDLNGIPRKITSNSALATAKNPVLGYIVYINDSPFVVAADGIFEIKEETGVVITSVYFPYVEDVEINYIADAIQEEDLSELASLTYYSTKVGQLWGSFQYGDSLFKKIWQKYYLKTNTFLQMLVSINGVRAEGDCGTVLYIKDNKDTTINRHVIGDTQVLSFYDEDSIVLECFFAGIHLEEAGFTDRGDYANVKRFIDTHETYDTVSEIEDPVQFGVYVVLDNSPYQLPQKERNSLNAFFQEALDKIEKNTHRYIMYNGKWYPFTDDNDVLIKVQGSLDYDCEVTKGVF